MATAKPKGSGLGGISRKKRTPNDQPAAVKETPPPPEPAEAPSAAAEPTAPVRSKTRKSKTKPSATKRSGSETKVTLPLDGERHQALRRLAFECDTTHRAVLLALIDIAADTTDAGTALRQAIGERTADKRLEKPRGPAPQSKSY